MKNRVSIFNFINEIYILPPIHQAHQEEHFKVYAQVTVVFFRKKVHNGE